MVLILIIILLIILRMYLLTNFITIYAYDSNVAGSCFRILRTQMRTRSE